MATKNVRLKDASGNFLYPESKAAVVYNNSNQNLGTVEAGAQVNILEKVKVNGVELTVTNKAVDVTVPSVPVYSMIKDVTPATGYNATYHLTRDGVNVGSAINIPKDMVVQSGSVKSCTVADNPVQGYQIGDKYIDLVLANADNSHIYILVSDLVDVYTAGTGISISNNTVSVDTDTIATKTFVNTGLSGKQDSLSTAQLNAVNSGITSAKVSTYDGYATIISGKADKATTLSGYGITDGVTYVEITS